MDQVSLCSATLPRHPSGGARRQYTRSHVAAALGEGVNIAVARKGAWRTAQ